MRKIVTAAVCTVFLAGGPAVAAAQTGSLGSGSAGISSSNIQANPNVSALKKAGVEANIRYGHRQNAEAERHAQAILSRALSDEFIYYPIPLADGTVGLATTRTPDGAANIFKLGESQVAEFIDLVETQTPLPTPSAPFGVAAGNKGNTYYVVEFLLGA